MVRRWQKLSIAIAAALVAPAASVAQIPVQPGPGITRSACMELGTLIDAQDLTTARSFSADGGSGFGLLVLWVQLVDADGSIARLDTTCTGSDDSNATDHVLQDCSGSAAPGVHTCVDAGVWQKPSPGSKRFVYRLDLGGIPDFECRFSVGAGTGAASDRLTVSGRLCAD